MQEEALIQAREGSSRLRVEQEVRQLYLSIKGLRKTHKDERGFETGACRAFFALQ